MSLGNVGDGVCYLLYPTLNIFQHFIKAKSFMLTIIYVFFPFEFFFFIESKSTET